MQVRLTYYLPTKARIVLLLFWTVFSMNHSAIAQPKLKTKTTYYYTAHDLYLNLDKKKVSGWIEHYNADGNITQKGPYSHCKDCSTQFFEYDEQGRITLEYWLNSKNEKYNFKHLVYNDQGQKVGNHYCPKGQDTTYTTLYNYENGRLASEREFDKDQKPKEHCRYHYDEQGRVIKIEAWGSYRRRTFQYSREEQTGHYQTSEFRSNGNLFKVETFLDPERKQLIGRQNFNEEGELIQEIHFELEGERIRQKTFMNFPTSRGSKVDFSYDVKGRLQLVKRHAYHLPDVDEKRKIVLNETGNKDAVMILKEGQWLPEEKFHYNESGQLVKWEKFTVEGQVAYRRFHFYDDQGRRSETQEMRPFKEPIFYLQNAQCKGDSLVQAANFDTTYSWYTYNENDSIIALHKASTHHRNLAIMSLPFEPPPKTKKGKLKNVKADKIKIDTLSQETLPDGNLLITFQIGEGMKMMQGKSTLQGRKVISTQYYDIQGVLISEWHSTEQRGLKKRLIYRCEYKPGKQSRKLTYHGAGKRTLLTKTTHYQQGKLIREKYEEGPYRESFFSYDKADRLVMKTEHKEDREKITYYHYDDQDRLIKSLTFEHTGSLSKKVVFEYSQDGREVLTTTSIPGLPMEERYFYTYH